VSTIATVPQEFAGSAARGRALPDWRRGLAWCVATLLVWLALVAWQREVLWWPPYVDFAMGVFTEANWLVENDFDYEKLRTEEPFGNLGGARVYMTSILPTLVAGLMIWLPSHEQVMLASHLFTLAFAAVLFVGTVGVSREGLSWPVAALVGAALATTPLVRAQTEMLGLDLPCATCGILAAWCLLRERGVLAALWSTMAFLMKPTGMLVTLVALAYLTWLAGCAWRAGARGRKRFLLVAFGAHAVALAVQVTIYLWGGISTRISSGTMMPFEYVGFSDVIGICPDLVLVVLLLSVVSGVSWLLLVWRQSGSIWSRVAAATFTDTPAARLSVYGWLTLVGTCLTIALYVRFPVPRYFMVAVPWVWILAGVWWGGVMRWERGAAVALAAMCAVNLVNTNGRFFPVSADMPRNGPALERSGEYRADHRAAMEAMKVVVAQGPEAKLLASHPWNYYAAIPRLGFTNDPQGGYTINPIVRPEFKVAGELFRDHPRELVVVYCENQPAKLGEITIPLPEEEDEILYDDGAASPLIVYRKRFEESPEAYDRWLLAHYWYDDTLENRPALSLTTRAAVLAKQGFADQAEALLRLAIERDPEDSRSGLALAEMLRRRGLVAAAGLRCMQVLAREPEHARAHLVLGSCRYQQGNLAAADEELKQALEDPESAGEAKYWLGLVRWKQTEVAEAESLLVEAAESGWNEGVVQAQLGQLQLERGELERAERSLERSVEVQPELALAHYLWGLVRREQGDLSGAAAHLQDAVRREPKNSEALCALGTVYEQQGDLVQAREQFALALAAEPNHSQAAAGLARTRQRAGQ
jgi:tetratricopeptide (TPR) repeat protein